MTRGTDLIAAERERHVSEEGYDAEHDRGHAGRLAAAGASYAFGQGYALQFPTDGGRQYLDKVPAGMWPWAWSYWKPSRSAVRTLVKAGALIAAAIDSLLDEQDARSSDPSQDAEIVGDVEYDSIRDEWRPAGSSDPYYPDCQPVPHNPLDCRGDGPEDHDPAYSSDSSPTERREKMTSEEEK